MPLNIIREDITGFQCDAIVNSTNRYYRADGGEDYAVHQAAGPELDRACEKLEPLSPGEVAVTKGYQLPCRYVIHTVGPIWAGGDSSEPVLLRSCYLNALIKAKELNLKTVAFPLISSGTHGFPKDRVLKIATAAISDFLMNIDADMEISLCIHQRNAYEIRNQRALSAYLQRNGREYPDNELSECRPMQAHARPHREEAVCYSGGGISEEETAFAPRPAMSKPGTRLSDWIRQRDDTFPVLLMKLMDQKGMDDVACYRKANVSRNTYWKIRTQDGYKPSKPTVLAFAIALELNLEETEALLKAAGFALSGSSISDRIIQFFIENEDYDIFEINAALCQYDQQTLGC